MTNALPEGERRRLTDFTAPPPAEIKAQKTALTHVVDAARIRLDAHNISSKSNVFMDVDKRDGYFSVPVYNGVLEIESLDTPTISPQAGLFVRIHVVTTNGSFAQLLSIQLPRESAAVEDWHAIEMLRSYPPIKMELLAGLIRNAKPISAAEYRTFMGPPSEVMAVADF